MPEQAKAGAVGGPIRFRISYQSPQNLLSEFTKSVSRGTVIIESRKAVPLGTRFVFELYSKEVKEPVEVNGEVISVRQTSTGFLLQVAYNPGERRGLDQVILRIFNTHRYEKVRKHPRMPVHLRAADEAPNSPLYIIRDISLGGMGVEVESAGLPKYVKIGERIHLQIRERTTTLDIDGTVVWTFVPSGERARMLNPSFGVRWDGEPDMDALEALDSIVSLKDLQRRDWRARLRIGAVAKGAY